jgi:hypothetical protein
VGIRISRRLLAGALVAALVAVAIGAAGGQAASTLPTLSIAINSSSATVSGAPPAGAVNVVTTDKGVKEATVILFRLNPGKTVADAEQFIKEKRAAHDPNNTIEIGSIVFDTEANPGANSEAQTSLQPGQYIVLVGAGEHVEPAVRSSFTIAAGAASTPLPTPQATVKTIEFGFKGPKTLRDGELVRFENEGFVVHMDIAFPVKNMKAAKSAVKDLLAGKEKALGKLIAGPPVAFYGPISHGAFMQETITAKPGIYVQVCFMETQDKRDHARLGMERIIKITK